MRNNQFLFLPLAATCYCYYMLLLYCCCCNNNANIGVQVVKGFRQQSSLSSSSLSLSQRISATTIRRKIKTLATTSATSTLFSLPSRQCSSSSDYLSIPTTTLSMTTTTTIDDKKKFQILGADDDDNDDNDDCCWKPFTTCTPILALLVQQQQ